MGSALGKLCYGILFVVLVPLFIGFWGQTLDPHFPYLPLMGTDAVGSDAVGSDAVGWSLMLMGFLSMASAWWVLYLYGKGLPMNAYPPKQLVQRGIYSVLPHPIYVGFTGMVAGYFILTKSAAGLWFVVPCIALGSAALVLGYERHDMKSRFGTADWPTMLRIPEATDATPTIADRVSVYALLYLPWLLIYAATNTIGPAADALDSYFAFEYELPVIEWMESLYGVTYLFVLSAPLIGHRKCDLRTFMQMGFWATVIGAFCWLILPLKAIPRSFVATSFLRELLNLERAFDGPAAAFPSFHVVWALLTAWLYTVTFRLKHVWYLLASMIALSCIATGMHSLLDVLGAFGLFALVSQGSPVWTWILQSAERIANSWREWRLGRVRVIIHGLYAGAAVFAGLAITLHLTGAGNNGAVFFVALAILLGAGLWGQAIEGSSKLSRPFGYYGGLLGGSIGIALVTAFGADGGHLIGAFAVAAPFTQAIGRVRCLVQGCCHGRECEPRQGIVYRHARSRVLYLADLGHRSVYPTPLYSLLYNVILGFLLVRAWTLAMPAPFLVGCYLILGGYGRFVEEAYRGEPQTPIYAGLALYQWLALVGIVAGAFATMVAVAPHDTSLAILPSAFAYSALFGLLTACATGVDFPESNRRFSRLT